MRRRTVLGAVGAGLVSIAGCSTAGTAGPSGRTAGTTEADTGSPVPGTRATATDTPVPTPDYPQSTGDLETFDPAETVEEVRVGSREGVSNPENNLPHDVRVWNAASTVRDVELRIVDLIDGSVVLDESYEIPADASVSLRLLAPSSYVVEVVVSEESAEETLGVPRSRFDCNSSATRVGITADGRIESMLISTAVFCVTPTATDE